MYTPISRATHFYCTDIQNPACLCENHFIVYNKQCFTAHTQCANISLHQKRIQCFCVSASFFILNNYDNTYSIAAEYPFAGEAAQHWIIQYSRSTVTEM